jgi:hypothetical protein
LIVSGQYGAKKSRPGIPYEMLLEPVVTWNLMPSDSANFFPNHAYWNAKGL